jgi:AraC-like DNA-binding protein
MASSEPGSSAEASVTESQERLSWAAIDGGTRLNAESSDRCWTLVHTQYAFCVLTRGAADWNYRGQRFTVAPGKVYVLEPGEVHTTVRAHVPGDFSVSFLDAEWMSQFSGELADLREAHFSAEGVASPEAWRGLVEASKLDPVTDKEEFGQSLSASLATTLLGELGKSRSTIAKPTLDRAKRALMDRYLAAPGERIRLEDVVRDLGLGYHRFVHDFSLQFGAAPYQYVKMLRAHYVVERIRSGPSEAIPSLTALAKHAGYSDMPHLSRELRTHFASAPREIARQLNPNWLKRSLRPPARTAQSGALMLK